MALRIRRGLNNQRAGIVFPLGELVWTTDTQQLWVGNNETSGGVPVVGSNVIGYGLIFNNTTKRIEVSGLSADDLTNGTSNRFFSTELAQDAAASLFTSGSHTGITFQYDDSLGKINAVVSMDGVGLTDIVNDTSPSLGGNLDINSFDITGTGDITVVGNITATGGTITASAYGNINAKTIALTDGVSANAGFVLTTDRSPDDGGDWFTLNSHHSVADTWHAIEFNRTRGTALAQTALQQDDFIFALKFTGKASNGTKAVVSSIGAYVAGTPSAGILPGSFAIATSDESGIVLPKLIIGPDGQQIITAPTLVAGSNPGQVDTGTISSWMKVNFNGVEYAVPMYAIRT